jgi:acyl-CoA hydrolase
MAGTSWRISTADEALALIESGSTIVTAMAAAEPRVFWSQAHHRIKDLSGVRLFCANPSQAWPLIADTGMSSNLEIIVMFLTGVMRKLQGRGFVHYMPQHLSHWSRNLRALKDGIDVFWGTCSPPDARGFVSLGTSNCYESEILRAAKNVILEVNPHMPQTYGATEVAISEVDCFIESGASLPVIKADVSDAVDEKIAEYIVDLIDDGSTLQLGIGGIPNAVGRKLRGKRDLGIHTEMINDAIMELYLQGIVTGRHKTIWPRKIVGAFAYGSEALYEFINQNPVVELHPASVVNDPYRIGRNHKMVSINTAVEIDLTGQVCSESVGHLELSGVGGASETHIGAQRSEGGRGIIALASTAKNGQVSKIVTTLKPGAKVSISRNDIDTVVTEYGVARLKGKTVPERIKEMARVAHPDFREKLLAEARDLQYI